MSRRVVCPIPRPIPLKGYGHLWLATSALEMAHGQILSSQAGYSLPQGKQFLANGNAEVGNKVVQDQTGQFSHTSDSHNFTVRGPKCTMTAHPEPS